MGERSVDQLLLAIADKQKGLPAHRLLIGLGIPGVGAILAERLSENFASHDDFLDWRERNPNALLRQGKEKDKGQGKEPMKVVDGIRAWLTDSANRGLVQQLSQHIAIQWRGAELGEDNQSSTFLQGLSTLVSGRMEGRSREEIRLELKQQGAEVTAAVSAANHCIFIGEEPGQNKLDKARDLGVPVLDAQDFDQVLQEPQHWQQILDDRCGSLRQLMPLIFDLPLDDERLKPLWAGGARQPAVNAKGQPSYRFKGAAAVNIAVHSGTLLDWLSTFPQRPPAPELQGLPKSDPRMLWLGKMAKQIGHIALVSIDELPDLLRLDSSEAVSKWLTKPLRRQQSWVPAADVNTTPSDQ